MHQTESLVYDVDGVICHFTLVSLQDLTFFTNSLLLFREPLCRSAKTL